MAVSDCDRVQTYFEGPLTSPVTAGYVNAPRATGKSLMQDAKRAPLVRRAFEEYATGRFSKERLLKHVRTWGLTNRRGKPLTSQAIDGNSFVRTAATAPAFSYLRPIDGGNEGLVDQTGIEPVTS
jgi:hypothetical protein